MVVHDEGERHHVPDVVEHVVDDETIQRFLNVERTKQMHDGPRYVGEYEDQEDRSHSCCFGHHHLSVEVAMHLDK